jgi:hypothetical protein
MIAVAAVVGLAAAGVVAAQGAGTDGGVEAVVVVVMVVGTTTGMPARIGSTTTRGSVGTLVTATRRVVTATMAVSVQVVLVPARAGEEIGVRATRCGCP